MIRHNRYVIAAGVGGALLLAGCGQKPSEASSTAGAAQADLQTVKVVRVAARPLVDSVVATGRLVSREEAAVSSELSGYRVLRVTVDEGDWVEKGQVLAELDGELLRAQIRQAEAAFNQQETLAQLRESQAARVEGLKSVGALSDEAIEQRVMDAQAARAAAAVQRASLEEMRLRAARMVLRAPVSGRVLQRTLRPGDIVSAGAQPYFVLSRDGMIELDAEVPESALSLMKPGQVADVTLASGEVLSGKVRFVSPRVEQTSSLGHVRITLPASDALRPGGFARATFPELTRNAVAVPESAIRSESGGPAVLLVDSDNRVSRVPVKLGSRSKGLVELLEGPAEGAVVLLVGASFTLEGDVVRPVEAEPAAAAPTQAKDAQ